MLRHLSAIIAAMICAFAAAAAPLTPAEDAFVNAPRTALPLLDRTTRLDMLDYYHANMSTPSTNALGGESRITDSSSPMSLSARLSDASAITLAMLPTAKGDSLRMVITTVETPQPDSRVQLYDATWRELPAANYFKAPVLADWVTSSSALPQVEAAVPFMLVTYAYNPESQTLTLTDNTAAFLGSDMWEPIAPLMKPTLAYKWNGSKFTSVR